MKAFLALVLKDLKLFFGDRRAVIMTLAAPIAIASFFGFVTGGMGGKTTITGVPIQVADLDQSSISREIVTNLLHDSSLRATLANEPGARQAVRAGKAALAIIIPKGFGDHAIEGLLGSKAAPRIAMPHDPSRNMEVGLVKGILTQQVMQTVTGQFARGEVAGKWIQKGLARLDTSASLPTKDRLLLRDLLQSVDRWQSSRLNSTNPSGARMGGLKMPFDIQEEEVGKGREIHYNGFAHSFGGMGVQFVLMAAIEFGIGLLNERRQGIWKRFRSAPLSRNALLGSHMASSAIISFFTLLAVFGFSMVVFRVRIQGSVIGFLLCCAAISIFAASLALFIGAIGKTPQATKGLAILVILIAVMLGGAWVPTFIFPSWVQTVALAVPTRWAIDGLAAMTWRGLGFSAVLLPIAVLLGYTILFSLWAVARFRWED